jgi:sortase A
VKSFLEFLRGFALSLSIGCLATYAAVCVYSALHQRWESEQFERARPSAESPATQKPRARREPEFVSGSIGRISIPRLRISAMVEEGDDDGTLSAAVGHIPGTALPGHAGNVGLAGHRDTFFARLKDLQRGDEIEFETRSQVYKYRIEQMMVVDPTNTSVLRGSDEKQLTLVTCYPFHFIGPAPRRFIVQARQIPAEHRSIASRAENFRPK